jgi:hypothetical protein
MGSFIPKCAVATLLPALGLALGRIGNDSVPDLTLAYSPVRAQEEKSPVANKRLLIDRWDPCKGFGNREGLSDEGTLGGIL